MSVLVVMYMMVKNRVEGEQSKNSTEGWEELTLSSN